MAQGSGDEGGRHLHVSGNWAEVPVRNLGVTLHVQSAGQREVHTTLHFAAQGTMGVCAKGKQGLPGRDWPSGQ